MKLINSNSSSSRVRDHLVSGRARAQTARVSTRVAAESFDAPRNGQGNQGNGPSSKPLAFEAQKYATVLSPRAQVSDASDKRNTMKLELLKAVSGTNRGTLANLPRHRKIWRLLQDLQVKNPTEDAFEGSPAALDGPWELLYSSAESFRSSPFFWAFQEGLVQDRDMAAAIFKFTDAIPGADIGRVVQRVDSQAGALVSEVDMTVFPGISGVLVTTSSISGVHSYIDALFKCDSSYNDTGQDPKERMRRNNKLECTTGSGLAVDVTVLDTRVDNSLFAPLLDNVVVPVKDLIERVRGQGATKTTVEVEYLDEAMRVMRTPDDHYFVYGRPA